jgi:acetyl-CoA C-acetyltransferase
LEPRSRRPTLRIRAFADHSVEPVLMLSGNIDATRKAVTRAGLALSQIDLFEVNDSFAAIPLQYRRALELPADCVNVNGGAIALGHPLGATGGILLATLLDELERRQLRYGVASICAGAGIAAATVIERV